jgi:hypothetical protein
MRTWFGYGWAAPVISRRWAFAATVLDRAKRLTRYRMFVRSSHRAWERAIGIS